MRMYGELAEWFHLLSPPQEYAEEAADYASFLVDACPDATTLLELGSGGGNTASYLKRRFACTLTDLSPEMLALSSGINPECEHIHGHMRTMRLGRQCPRRGPPVVHADSRPMPILAPSRDRR